MIDKYSKDLDYTYVLGIALVIDALKYIPNHIRNVFISSSAIHNKEYEMLISLCKNNKIEYIVDDKTINHLSNKENCYGIAIIDKYILDVDNDRHVILKDFNDEGELGTIIRTMASFNYKNLVLINCNIDVYNPMVIRSSMGGYFYVNKSIFNSFDDYIDKYKNEFISIGIKGDKALDSKLEINDRSLLFNADHNDFCITHKVNSNLSLSSVVGISLDLFKKL